MATESGKGESWPDQATDLIVTAVGTVRDKTVGPAMTGARAIVYGLFSLLVGIFALTLTMIFVIRIITVYTGKVWIAQLGLGVVFGIVALVLWSKARRVPHR